MGGDIPVFMMFRRRILWEPFKPVYKYTTQPEAILEELSIFSVFNQLA